MPHAIATTNGRPAMAYFGDTPWHRLGTRLEQPATAEEAIVVAGLDYEVELASLYTADGRTVPQRKAVIRTDANEVLGVVGNSYSPIQNRECFQFLDAVVAEGQLEYHTAGALGNGERVWMLAKLPGFIRVKASEDHVEKYLLLSNSHNGTSALRVFFTPIRVVCANTLAVAHRQAVDKGVSVLHKGDLGAKVREAQEILGLAARFYDDVQVKVDRLASRYPTKAQVAEYFRSLYPNPKASNKTRARNTRKELFQLFEAGRGQNIYEVRHSWWAAYNAVTEYVDHRRPTRARSEPERANRRLQSQWFGSGARLKTAAWDLALDLSS
ncbi:MAG: DUF932 domain-containing protein [Planctomycetota bacterium]|nr:MAG: DUF932 domain-containing protein [Planctomycetota bacterium]REK25970.1 MAG: DUF932 domain-containing protein [Planctomycetota bacterium]REK46914.1 MAG: DUF932 domain-containing protein [Planctomycetota bacterium]